MIRSPLRWTALGAAVALMLLSCSGPDANKTSRGAATGDAGPGGSPGSVTGFGEPKDLGESVKMLTFNVQFLPDSDDDETRSKRIASRIKAVDYDIVALNEVFDEEARETFVEQLKGTFPNYVSYLGDDAVGSQDSGLMLFSKFGFQQLPDDTYQAESDDVEARNNGADWKDVAFIEYDDDFPDNWAAKGAAFVRIRNPASGRIYNVAFTHLQASYPEDEADHGDWNSPLAARNWQLKDVQKVIEGSLLPGMLGREDTFLLGDLNIDGDQADTDLGHDTCCTQNLWEWTERFDNPGTFFTHVIRDAWATEQSTRDRGLTNLYHGPPFSPDQGARLDYFARNRTVRDQLCVQHMTLAHNMRGGSPTIESGFGQAGPAEYSDHIGINIDLNGSSTHCDPRAAYAQPPLDQWISKSIARPGGVQWYRFDKPGTYAFAVKGADVDFRVYSGEDMSTPVPQYYDETIEFTTKRGEPVEGKKFTFPKRPYYVKVFNKSRTAAGPYQFIAHRATCASKEEACVLRAADPIAHELGPNPINGDDTAWFEFHTEAADSGQPQALRLKVDKYAPDGLQLRLADEDGTTVLAKDLESEPDPADAGKRLLDLGVSDAEASKRYLKVKRLDLGVDGFRVGWDTNLTVLHGQSVGIAGAASANLYCVEETDGVQDIDEIWLTVKVDGKTVVDDKYIGDYDNGDYRTMEDYLGAIRYLDKVQVTLRDEDGGASGGDDYLKATIGGLPPGVTEKLNQTSVLACCDGKYLLRYNRSRSLLT